jgi:hypothetical protein
VIIFELETPQNPRVLWSIPVPTEEAFTVNGINDGRRKAVTVKYRE